MKPYFSTLVVIPVGPKCLPDYVMDTISSYVHYAGTSYKIILADDSGKDTGKLVQEQFPAIDVLVQQKQRGKLAGLYITLSLAFVYALDNYHFDMVLRMDTDALVIGESPEKEAELLFRTQPLIGMAGQYPREYSGKPWDVSWPASQLKKLTRFPSLVSKPVAHMVLRNRYHEAVANGYVTGESVFGGACFYSKACLVQLRETGLLPDYRLQDVNLEEDHLFSLLVRSIGLGFGDLSGPGYPFGCAWLGLPASPEELQAAGKKIIHSTRYWNNMNEDAIRTWFRNKRENVRSLYPVDGGENQQYRYL